MDANFSQGGAVRVAVRSVPPKRRWAYCAACGLIGLAAPPYISPILASEDDAAKSGAAELVQAALESELVGDNASRAAYLAEARMQGGLPAAQWHAGRVQFEGQWLTPEAVAAAASSDPVRQEYRRRRNSSEGTLADHQFLAEWCADRGLVAEERFHRKAILQRDPTDERSLRRLGLRQFRGVFATDDQIDQMVAERRQRDDDLKSFGRTFKRWLNEALRTDGAGRNEIVARFRGVDDIAALEALKEASAGRGSYLRRLQRRLGADEGERYWAQLRVAMVEAVGSMDEHEATLELARTAVFSGEPALRSAASLALRDRRPTDYIPLLMSELQSLIEAEIDVAMTASGDVTYTAVFREEGVESNREHVDSFTAVTIVDGRPTPADQARIDARRSVQYGRARGMAMAARNEIDAINSERDAINARVIRALRTVTGEDWGDDPAGWRAHWAEYNDVYYPEDKSVDATQSQAVDYDYVYIPVPAATQPTSQAQLAECFAVGTLVWTQTGPERIETIVPGDLVLSQDPLTGELAYQPVVATTVRPPTKFVELDFADGDRISATRGHRFWVAGEGWRMARFLEEGQPLHALSGSKSLVSARQLEGDEAYNLIVDEFHTYFVGQTKALVHDTTCPRPTRAPLPGMEGRRVPGSQADGYQSLSSTP